MNLEGVFGFHPSSAGSTNSPEAAEPDAKDGGGLQPIGPDAAQIEAIRQSWYGGWIGRATALGLMIAAYIGALGPLRAVFWGEEQKFAEIRVQEPVFFWIFLGAPLAFILLFSVLPEAARAWRDHKLRAALVRGQLFDPGYFRLRPYEERDGAAFRRDDNAHEDALAWIRAADSPLLYLTGASGVGKSSLLAAYVLPNLRKEGWRTVSTRSFGDPEKALIEALHKPEAIWDKPPTSPDNARTSLEKASHYLRTKGVRLLVVLEQFEEFVILHDEARRARFAALLQDLVAEPIRGVTLLLVLRSDYTPAIRKLNLPQLRDGENWCEVSPFMRPIAEVFLRRSGKEISPQLMERILRGLTEIEATPGLFRPVTLNMLGLVLARARDRLDGHPERLIQQYLRSCLAEPEIRSDAPQILAPMITDAGTKRPQSEAELAAATGLEPWRIVGCLLRLDRHGLVRPLDRAQERWEIAHDFLARLIGQLLGHLRPSLWSRARPWLAPTLLVLWIPLLLLLPMAWQGWRDSHAREVLQNFNVKVGSFDGHWNVASFPPEVTDDDLRVVISYLSSASVKVADLRDSEITDLTLLADLPDLSELRLDGSSLRELTGIARLVNLETLSLSGARVDDLAPLLGLNKLSALNLNRTAVQDLQPLEGLPTLQALNLGNTGVAWLGPLSHLHQLEELELPSTRIRDLGPLAQLDTLRTLNLHETMVEDISPLAKLPKLERLVLRETRVRDLAPLASLKALKSLDLGWTPSRDLTPLSELSQLNTLNLSWTQIRNDNLAAVGKITTLRHLYLTGTRVDDLSPLEALTGLRTLYLWATEVQDLQPVASLINLETLDLQGTPVVDLAPLSALHALKRLELGGTDAGDLWAIEHVPHVVGR